MKEYFFDYIKNVNVIGTTMYSCVASYRLLKCSYSTFFFSNRKTISNQIQHSNLLIKI